MTADEVTLSPAVRRGFSYPDPEPEAAAYAANAPFPHTVIKDAWEPGWVAECKREIAVFSQWDGEKDFYGSRKKRYCGDIEKLPPTVVRIIREASSPAFLLWLTAVTGEQALMPDPYLEGGGIHQIIQGGFLKVHADFNWNERLQLYRRLNLLLYLNPGWDASWGGALELWTQDMGQCGATVLPEANTMVIFTTDDRSFHGHPHPTSTPIDVTRDSIALYYYSPIKPASNFAEKRVGTDYRPIEGDSFAVWDKSFSARAMNRLRKLLGAAGR